MTGWLQGILDKARQIKAAELRSEAASLGMYIPENPTADDFRRLALELAQEAKIVQNTTPGGRWSPEQFRKISKATENLENIARKSPQK